MITRLRLLAFTLLVAVSCDGPTRSKTPTPGYLEIVLASANSDDAALWVSLTGPDIGAIETPAGLRVFPVVASPTRREIIVVGDIGPGTVVRFHVPDTAKRKSYAAILIEVADATNAQRAPLTGYSLRVVR